MHSLVRGEDDIDPMKLMRVYGELIVEIRKDLGHESTECTEDDYLNIILADWWKIGAATS